METDKAGGLERKASDTYYVAGPGGGVKGRYSSLHWPEASVLNLSEDYFPLDAPGGEELS